MNFVLNELDIAHLKPAPDAIDYHAAKRLSIIPATADDIGPMILITSREIDKPEYSRLRFMLNREILIYITDPSAFRALFNQAWPEDNRPSATTNGDVKSFKAKVIMAGATEDEAKITHFSLRDSSNQIPVIQLVDKIFSEAISLGASDIHLEPAESQLSVRFRLDGVLQPAQTIPKFQQNELLSRIKILARMDIAEKRRPQDGRILVQGKDRAVDVRVSSMPTAYGEKIVLRLLDKSQQPLDLSALGLAGANYELFNEAIRKPHGMVLVTGPTGSGKTTTLYAALKAIHSPQINISTVEDPIEYQIEGINQTQMHAEIDYTFAAAVRTFLRQDPDVIMIGEIRDPETAKYAIQAAQTGHLVFSTLHTNDAPSAIIRLLEMGMEPFLVASTVHLIIAQRLVRKTCRECGKQRTVLDADKSYAGESGPAISKIFKGEGCPACAKTGYKGRMGAFEIMRVTPEIQDLVTCKTPTQIIREKALEQGMKSLKEEGLRLVANGITTIDELRSSIG